MIWGMQRNLNRSNPWLYRNVASPLCYDGRRAGRWREPFGFWRLVALLLAEGPRPRTFARWWAIWRGDVARRREWARIRAMPPGPERDEVWAAAFCRSVGAAKTNIESALSSAVRR